MQPQEQPSSQSTDSIPVQELAGWPPKLWRMVLGALLAAGVGLGVLKLLYPIFSVPVEIATFPEQSPLWMYERLDKAKLEVDGKNFAVVFGIIGAVLGASCVLISFGLRSIKAILIAIFTAGALGVAGAFLSNTMFGEMRANSGNDLKIMGIALDGMKQSILGYSLLWGMIGLGLGIGIGSDRGLSKSVIAGISGLVGGVLASMLFVIATAQISIGTTMNTVLPHADLTQAIWLVTFTLVVASCIALGLGEKRPKQSA